MDHRVASIAMEKLIIETIKYLVIYQLPTNPRVLELTYRSESKTASYIGIILISNFDLSVIT